MSQILVSRQKRREHLLYQDLYFTKKPTSVKTSVTEALCSTCKRGLEDGLSITAKTTGQKIKLYCSKHFGN